MSAIRRHLTYANLVATLALLLALGTGGAYAAGKLAPKSVGEQQLRPGAVTAEKLRKNAIIAPKIKGGAVKGGKLANGAVSEPKLAGGAVTNAKLGDDSVTTAKIASGAVTGSQVEESSLGQVPSAARADFATAAEAANPLAFAKVEQDGSVDPTLSKGISSADVSQGSEPGIYCIAAPGIGPRGAQATPQYTVSSGAVLALVTVGGSACVPPRVEVQIRSTSGALTKAPFYIALYR
jgi:hypothetical protein